MNSSELLLTRRIQNKERRNREEFLTMIDGDLQHLMRNAVFIYGNDIPESISNSFIDIQSGSNLNNPIRLEFDDIELLLDELPQKTETNKSGYLSLGSIYPIFKVNIDEVFDYIADLTLKINDFDRFYLISDDVKNGLIITEYVGYLPKERQTNNREIIYSLIYWGFGS